MFGKFFVLLLFVSILTLTTSLKLQMHEQKCVKETGVNRNYIKQHRDHLQYLLYNSTTRCYAACVLREMGTMKKNGHYNIKKTVKNLSKDLPHREDIIDVYKQCARKRGENVCETTFQISKCILENKIIRETFYPTTEQPVPGVEVI